MADKKISELTELTEAEASDSFAVVDASVSKTKKITYSNLVGGASKTELSYLSGVSSNIQNQLDAKADIADSETITGSWIFNSPIRYDSGRSITDLYHLVDKKYVDEAVTSLGARYYMLDTDSGEADYKLCSLTPSAGAEQNVSKNSLTDDQYIIGWISPNTNEPDKLIAGVYNWRIFAEKTGGTKTLRLYWKLVERKNDDSEVVIGTSAVSDEITTGKSSYIIPLTLSADHDIASDYQQTTI